MDYKVVVVIWQDHMHVSKSPVLHNIESIQFPTLSIGIIVKETDDAIILASDIERYEDRDDVTYTIIYKSAIVSTKEYGEIEILHLKIE